MTAMQILKICLCLCGATFCIPTALVPLLREASAQSGMDSTGDPLLMKASFGTLVEGM